jgi:hypothetical protein
LKEGVDKFMWVGKTSTGDSAVWAAFGVTVDKPAKEIFAEFVELKTYEMAHEHTQVNAGLPRKIRKAGGHSTHYRVGNHLPEPLKNRLFDNWLVWKEVRLDNGHNVYVFGLVPLCEYPGAGFEDFNKNDFVLGEARGLIIVSEVASHVCRVTRIQTGDLKLMGIPVTLKVTAMEHIARLNLKEANRLQEKFRRNGKKVDAEVREALVERIKERIELEEGQKEVFKELEDLFEGTSKWEHVTSPFEGVKMEIKHQQQRKDERSISIVKGQGVADCTAEEGECYVKG